MDKLVYMHEYTLINLYIAIWSINIYTVVNNTMQYVYTNSEKPYIIFLS